MAIKVGEAEILRVEELRTTSPITNLTSDRDFVEAQMDWLAPAFFDRQSETYEMVFQSWIVRRNGLTLVVDPCNGNGRDLPLLPQFHQLDTPYLERFEAIGVRPEQVDMVFCTHLHCDHCGWNTQLRDGRWVPTFPKARYMFMRREVERWDPSRPGHQPAPFNVGVFEAGVAPIIDAGLAELVEDGGQIAPGLRTEAAPGHTLGNAILRMDARGEEVWFTGDVFHHPLEIARPELRIQYSDDPAAALATRQRLRAELADNGALLVPAHFQAPYCGRVVRTGDAYRFEAEAAA
jgi:glyoxylase-like metal-dependent hydrolase (beta-lactamase superfamily II)